MDKELFYDNNILNKNKLRRSWVLNNTDESSLIDIFSKNLIYFKYSQILYHYINNIPNNVNCKYCGSINNLFIGFKDGYKPGCSKSCNIILSRSNAIITRRNNTINKYGVDHTSKLDSVKKKTIETNLKKYGESHPSKNKDILSKIINTNIKRYGVKYPLESKLIYNKLVNTTMERYGVSNYSKTKDFLLNIKKDGIFLIQTDVVKDKIKISNYNKNLIKIKKNYEIDGYTLISYNTSNLELLCHKCNDTFNINIGLAHQRIFKNKIPLCIIHNSINNKQSSYEVEIINFLKSIGVKNIIESDRTQLGEKLEIDIWLPDYNIGIEFNGLFWHSDKFKDKFYHEKKYLLGKSKDIEIINIWQDSWVYKSDIIKSILSNKFNKIENKLFARKCYIAEVNNKTAKEFLNKNHIQGWCVSKHNIGLFFDNKLLSLMSFGYKRINLGNKIKNNNEYELLRFCNAINTIVIGGYSKIFKYFIENYKPIEILSFSDNDLFNGGVYNKLGMSFISETGPNYYWSDNYQRYNRWKYRKDNLVKMGYDENKTADTIMLENGYFKCWNTGNKKWLWKSILN